MGARSRLKRMAWLLLCLLLLLPLNAWADDDAPEAEELTVLCAFTWTGGVQERAFALTDGKINTSCRMKAGDALIIRADRDMGTLLLRFYQTDSAFLLLQRREDGRQLGMGVLKPNVALTIPLKTGCREIELRPLGEGLRICEAAVFGPGALPADVPHPEAPLKKADFLLVATHPDDEWVFLGGVYPLYGGERGYAGTVVYMTLPTWERAQECINGLWIGGVRTHPFFLGFADVRKNAPQWEKDTVKREDVTLALVRLYRQIQPLVVVTQDPENGEYGHWQHKLSASAARDAVSLAADPTYDPVSAAQYGAWNVQKLYQHFAEGMSRLELDVDTPLASYGGKTALQVANAAFLAHRTQLKTPYRPGAADSAKGDVRHFGLTWSVVGPDTGNDLFEHIPEEALAANQKSTPPATLAPTVDPTATAAASPAPTETPSSAPTELPSLAPTREPTPGPRAAPSAWDRAEERANWAADHAAILSAGIVLLLTLIIVLRQIVRANRHRRRLPVIRDRREGEREEKGADR